MQQDSGNFNTGSTGTQGGTGLAPNVAGALCYVLGLITGIVFVLIEPKDQFVRFHAFQSILVTVALIALAIILTILTAILAVIPIIGWILGAVLGLVLSLGIGVGGFILWLLLMFKAYQGERWKIPYIGEMAERYAGSQPF